MRKDKKFRMLAFVLVMSFLLAPVALMAGDKINLNTATLAELSKMKRIGSVYAQRIIDYREKNGPFEKIEDIMKVKGVGKKTYAANKDIMTVE